MKPRRNRIVGASLAGGRAAFSVQVFVNWIGAGLCAFSLFFAGACAAQETDRTLRIASEGARPPYNYIENNELTGFEIDLARDLCRRMEARCTFQRQDWDDLIPGLIDKKFDAVFAALEITDERAERIAFSLPYVRMPSAFVIAAERPLDGATPNNLAGRKIGVEADSPYQAYLEAKYKNSDIRPYAGLEDSLLDLAEGRLDAVFAGKEAAADFLKNHKEGACCRLLADTPSDPAFFGEGIGVGLRQQDGELRAAFDKALQQSFADGGFEKIRARYFPYKIR